MSGSRRKQVGGALLSAGLLAAGCGGGTATTNDQGTAYLRAVAPVNARLAAFKAALSADASGGQVGAATSALITALTAANEGIAAIDFTGNAVADSRTVISDDEALIGDLQGLQDGSAGGLSTQLDRDVAQLNGAVVVLRSDLGLPQLSPTAESASPVSSAPSSATSASAAPLPSQTEQAAPWAGAAVDPATINPQVLRTWRIGHSVDFPCDLYFPTAEPRSRTPLLSLGGSSGVEMFDAQYAHTQIVIWPPKSASDAASLFRRGVAYKYADGTEEHQAKNLADVYDDVLLSIPHERCFYEVSADDHADFDNALDSLRRVSLNGGTG